MRFIPAIAASILGLGSIAVPTSAEAAGLCPLISCGQIVNDHSGKYFISFKCANGTWHRIYPGQKSTKKCQDTQKFSVPFWHRTEKYSYSLNRWYTLAPGTHNVHDIDTIHLRRR